MNRSPRQRLIWFFVVLLIWLGLDLLTKYYIFHSVVPEVSQSETLIEGYLRITHVKNTGAVWGLFQGLDTILFYFNLIITPLLLTFFLYSIVYPSFLVSRCNVYYVTSIALIMAGAFGNLVDRISLRYVRDFLDVTIPIVQYRWPVFNLADAGITVGAAVLAYFMFVYPPQTEEMEEREPVEADE